MRNIVIVLVIVAVVVGIGVGVGYFAGGGSGTPPPAQISTSEPAPPTRVSSTPTDLQAMISTQTPPMQVTSLSTQPLVQASNLAPAATNLAEAGTNWEDTIDNIIGSDDPDTNKVKQLFTLFPKLPPDGQEEAVQHLSNLVEDDAYAPLGELLKDPKLPEGVLDELLADVLNRPNSVKLTALADVASNPDHAKRDEAKDLLELYLGDELPPRDPNKTPENTVDYDWSKVKSMVTNWLQQNPD